ncbi:DUF4974 domain-containing protein [Maribellus luteus]|uniref:DUF4974 domain-containing protein n=1 Tax=Maribellus luteus TaxID=2305463 RepID=A0A399SVN7_9BACT|nr:FecR family protein [Maribellus luteus]RIJ46371.1 DUF4974 domain-containing protein [Maribellus luteus]
MRSIIQKYMEGRANEKEQKELLVWLRKKDSRVDFDSQKLDWERNLNSQYFPKGGEKVWHEIQDHMLNVSFEGWQHSKKMSWMLKIAAVFLLLIGLSTSTWFLLRGHDGGTMYTSIMADKGQVSKAVLPDGSIIWLNSGSEIKYNNRFGEGNRLVELQGEAYFKVTKNADLPFSVNNSELTVRVFGTAFNVKAFDSDDEIDIVLEEGSVGLIPLGAKKAVYNMVPGQHANFNKLNKKLLVRHVNTTRFTSWKEGIVNIFDQPLFLVVERLENRYNQHFELEEEVKDIHFTFTIKNESLSDIIKLMEKIAPVKAEQKENTIVFRLDKTQKLKLP